MSDSAKPPPSRDLFAELMAQLAKDAGYGDTAGLAALHRRIVRWRLAAFVAAIVALGLLVVPLLTAGAPEQYVATLTPEGGEPGFVLTVDAARRTLAIHRIAGSAPAGKSYELWAIGPDKAPKSLGAIEQADEERPFPMPADGLTLAISLEPQGGSPTGTITGPTLFSGALVRP